MAESLARRDHPEEFNVWADPQAEGPILAAERRSEVASSMLTSSRLT
jgi:inosine-uridine nucleoside N-ribohydrolase